MGRFDWDRSAEDRAAARPAGQSSRREQICPFGVETQPTRPLWARAESAHAGKSPPSMPP